MTGHLIARWNVVDDRLQSASLALWSLSSTTFHLAMRCPVMHKPSDFHLQTDYYKSCNLVTAIAKPVSQYTRYRDSIHFHDKYRWWNSEYRPSLVPCDASDLSCVASIKKLMLQMTVKMGLPTGMGIPWESTGNPMRIRNKTATSKWEREGVGINVVGNGKKLPTDF